MLNIDAQIDELRHQLADTTDLQARSAIVGELGRLNRKKVLAPRGPLPPSEWMPIPMLSYRRPNNTLGPGGVKDLIKTFFWMVATGLTADGGSTPDDFVTLFRFAQGAEFARLTLICPYAHLLCFVEQMTPELIAGKAGDEIVRGLGDLEIDHRYTLIDDLPLPLVFSRDRAANRLLLINKNHFADPAQFMVPALCTTSSGFLNFIGAVQIAYAVHHQKNLIVSEPEDLMNQGLDAWFRWLYCAIDTGKLFSPGRMYVRQTEPEKYDYTYEG